MESKGRKSWLPWTGLLAGLAFPLGACIDGVVGQIEVCSVDGRGYAAGQTYASSDGCSTCTCLVDGKVSCTDSICIGAPDGGAVDGGPTRGQPSDGGVDPSCLVGDRWFAPGEPFLAPDGCNACICGSEGLSCTDKACGGDGGGKEPGKCRAGSVVYSEGATYTSEDGCSTCACQADGLFLCQHIECDGGFSDGGVPDASYGDGSVGTCEYDGKTHRVGDSFGARDECNTCSCLEGGVVACTLRACAPTCTIGNGDPVPAGAAILCEDGCNTCACTASGWQTTTMACPPLGAIAACPSPLSAGEKVTLRYIASDALAVVMESALCKDGRFDDYSLCYVPSFDDPRVQATILALPTGAGVPCGSHVAERVVDLAPLRNAHRAAGGSSDAKLTLGSLNQLLYQTPL